MKQQFILEYWEDDGWFVGRLKGIPGVFSQGETLAELEANIRDVYQLMWEEERQNLPNVKVKELALEL